MSADWIGWVATAVFVGSYLCTRADALRKVQMVGAALWIGYGVVMQAAPVDHRQRARARARPRGRLAGARDEPSRASRRRRAHDNCE